MPSCVVKICQNHSGSTKKSQGITFHRFPSANDVWKKDWVQIIRECRNQHNWNPSKSSVICSNHFEEHDLYTTKGGLLRVVAYAVPKKLLFETSTIKEEQPAEANISSALQVSSSVVGAFSEQKLTSEQSCILNTNSSLPHDLSKIGTPAPGVESEKVSSEPPTLEDQPTEANISSASQVSSSVVGAFSEQGLTLEQSCILSTNSSLPHDLSKIGTPAPGVESEKVSSEPPTLEDQPTEANISSASQVSSSVVGAFSEQGLTLEQSCILRMNSSLPHDSCRTGTPSSGVKSEQASSVLYTPRERRMKTQLIKMHSLTQKQKRKIKTLNQKVRRLQERNKSLKTILKTLKKRESR